MNWDADLILRPCMTVRLWLPFATSKADRLVSLLAGPPTCLQYFFLGGGGKFEFSFLVFLFSWHLSKSCPGTCSSSRDFAVSGTVMANIVENGERRDHANNRGLALNSADSSSCPNRLSWTEERESEHGCEAAWFQHLLKSKMPSQLLSVTGFLHQKEKKCLCLKSQHRVKHDE